MRRSVRDFAADVLHRPTGQVRSDSELGRWITMLSSLAATRSIVEVGTWRGNGTTRQIALGLAQRQRGDATAVCVEADREMAAEAARRHQSNASIRVVWGRLVGPEDVDDSGLTAEEQQWLTDDLARLRDAPWALPEIPDQIDLLILDGGEFTTRAEFELLHNRVTRWILLDDTRTRKCRQIVETVRSPESHFAVVAESDERNGVMVLRRQGESAPFND